MNYPNRTLSGACLALAFAFTPVLLCAQRIASAAPDPATLAKYDRNHNGILDADERAAMEADAPKPIPVETRAAGTDGADVVTLSPFEVVSDQRGYYSSNTMSGTRFNSKIEDLGMPITVVTKEQMEDFAMLDINDIFNYTASTEGTGTFTDLTIDRNGSVADNVELDPANANRVRGIAAANVSVGNFETMGRTPVDPLAIDGVEVSRGPNANVFGLGSPAGTVNQVPASANLRRPRTQAQVRGDSYGGYRTSLDLNRPLVQDKLALRVSGAFQHDGYVRKPSGTNTVRYNGMIKYRPFKNTTLSASYSYYRLNGNRPNVVPPRDYISYWRDSGAATWDPVTQEVHLNGKTVGKFPSATGMPDYLLNTFTGSSRSQIFVDQAGLGYWTTPTSNSGTAPGSGGQPIRFVSSSGAAGIALGHVASQPLFTTTPSVSDQDLYDWESINLAAVNRIWDRTATTSANLDQVVFNTPRQSLFMQAAFLREDSMRYQRNLVSGLNQNGQSGQLIMDVNERLLDGTRNPYFLRPFIGTDQPREGYQPARWDTYRAQLAYKLDLTQEKNALRWLGLHQFTAYDEYKDRVNRSYSYRDVIADQHAWVPGANTRVAYFRYYVGDNQGYDVDYAPSQFAYGTYPFVWGNGVTGVFQHEPTKIDRGAYTGGASGGTNTVLKTYGAVLQSHFLGDRLVTTFGMREDKVYARFGVADSTAAPFINPDGLTYNFANINRWQNADWRFNSGKTKTSGFVVKPFRRLGFVDNLGKGSGASRFAGQVLGGLSLSYNKSDSFTPQTPAQDLFLRPLPNSSGEGEDYGFTLNLFDSKFVLRFNHYINKSLNARNGDANTIAQRVLRHDVSSADPFQLFDAAVDWITVANPNWTTAQIEAEAAKQIGISLELRDALRTQNPPIAATNDVYAKGNEIEINYNPTRFWTLAGSVTDTQSMTMNVSRSVQDYIDQRMPLWTTIKDPTIDPAVEPQQLWWTHNYGGSQTAAQNFATFVEAPYGVIREQEGKPKPQVRRYAAKLSTNVRLAGLTEHAFWKKFSVGGSLRWEDKGSIGFYGVQSLPATITALDPNRPIYDEAHTYIDAFVTYRTRLWRNKVGATFQLNARNIQESGRLQPIAAFPDGSISSYRIVDPRQFILTATFDL